jgi:hypothetical protein
MVIQTPTYINANLFQDGQSAGSIVPLDVRTVVNSLIGMPTTTQSGSYTFVLADAGTCIESLSATAVTFTVPLNATVAFDTYTVLQVRQYGAGQVTIAPAAGVTLRTAAGTLTTRAQYAMVWLHKRGTDEWIVSGELS